MELHRPQSDRGLRLLVSLVQLATFCLVLQSFWKEAPPTSNVGLKVVGGITG